MTYKEYKKWELENTKIIVDDTLKEIEIANEQLSKAIVDNDKKLVKYWGFKCYQLETDLPYYEWRLDTLRKEIEQ